MLVNFPNAVKNFHKLGSRRVLGMAWVKREEIG
jgi:hypothetical protein